ncbi:MAG: hypothetical protein AB1430_23880 [Pseudomonadota bacterium]
MRAPELWLLGALALAAAAAALWEEARDAERMPMPAPAALQPRAAPRVATSAMPPAVAPANAALPAARAVPAAAAPPVALPDAAHSMAHARLHGDDRAPPIDRPAPEEAAPQPTPWDLSDPARYQAFEQREKRRVEAAYLQASEQALPRWREALAEARLRGAPDDELAAGEEKIRRLEAVSARLHAAAASAP